MKILFYHYESKLYGKVLYSGMSVFAKSTSLYLKTYLDIKKPGVAKQIEWCVPQQLKLNDSDLIQLINTEKPNILATTHYIWNYRELLKQLERIKPLIDPNIVILAGGPSVDVNVNPDYFKDYNFIDYAFYGPGEKAFAGFIESLVNNTPLDKTKLTNMAWPDSDRNAIVADYEYVPQLKTSPYLHSRELLKDIVDDMKAQDLSPIISYELTRGCPYTCTFCDWNSGFGNKTTRRKESYKDEIDLFQELGVTGLFLADANLGQYQEDVDMVEYFADRNINHGAKFKLDYTVSKLRKDNNLKIFHSMAKANLCTHFVISVQDTNDQVLEYIDRPDVGWDVHRKHITALAKEYPHIPSVVQIIQGLPGQTVDSFRKSLLDVVSVHAMPFIYVNELVPASPAARSQEYKDVWNFEYSDALRWDYMGKDEFCSPFSMTCKSFTKEDFLEMTLLSLIYTAIGHYIVYTVDKQFKNIDFSVDKIVDEFLASENYYTLKDNLWNNWQHHNKFYWTLDMDGSHVDEYLTACSMPVCDLVPRVNNNQSFLKWTLKHLSPTTDDHAKKEYAKFIIEQVNTK